MNNSSLRIKLMAAFGVALVLIAGAGVFSWSSTANLVDNTRMMDHTHEVLEALERVVSQLDDAETAQRGFVITGEPRYLEPYHTGVVGVELAVPDVRRLTSDDPSQQRRLDVIESLIQRKLDELSQTIDLRRNTGFESAREIVLTDAEKRTMDDVRAVITEMKQEEIRLLEQQNAATASTVTKTRFAVIFGTIVSTAIFGIIALFLSWTNSKLENEVQERKRTEQKLEDSHANLEIRVQERTAELLEVNQVMTVVDEVARIITSTLNIDEVYEKFALEVKNLVGFDRMNINIIDYGRNTFEIKYQFGEEALQLSVNTTGPLEGTPTGKVADTGQTLLQHDIALGPRSPIGEQFLQMGLRSSVKVPLVSKGRVIGTLGLRRRRVGAYGLWEQAILERLANQIAPAVENARMHEERVQAEEQLSQAQKMESVGQLAGGVAHDFSNLLTVIMGFSQLLLEEAPPESPTNNYLQEIQKATERAANLTNQLLAFSRRQVIEPKVIDLNGLVMNLDNMLRRLIGEDIELVTLPAANLESVKADPGQIEQVLMNLAVNAQDAMGEGGKLTIETANVTLDAGYVRQHGDASPGRHVMLTVSDTGMGMSEEVQDHIFEPFFTTKEVGKGTGLGLATCFGIVQQSGGHIEVRSEPGRGTSFKVYLPVTEEASEDQPEIVDSSSSAQGQETVLLAEDEPLVRSMAATVLRDRGYEVLQAANGEEALGAVQKHGGEGIDLLLTDVVMPQMGGPELAEKLHASHPNIKVLFTSGYIGEYLSQLNTLNTGTEFLAKPYLPETLAVKVREVLDRRAV